MVTESCISLALFPQNTCIREIRIQSLDEYIVYNIKKAIKLQYFYVNNPIKKLLPIKFKKGVVIMPRKSGFKIVEQDYFYKVCFLIRMKRCFIHLYD